MSHGCPKTKTPRKMALGHANTYQIPRRAFGLQEGAQRRQLNLFGKFAFSRDVAIYQQLQRSKMRISNKWRKKFASIRITKSSVDTLRGGWDDEGRGGP